MFDKIRHIFRKRKIGKFISNVPSAILLSHFTEDYAPLLVGVNIGGCGFGCVMTMTSVLEDIALNAHNWFEPLGGFGEDLSFCIRAMALKANMVCNSAIKMGHTASYIVNEETYKESKANGTNS